MQYSVSPRLNVEQLRAEPERERQDADADPPGHQEVAELVHEDQHAQHEQERKRWWSHVNLRSKTSIVPQRAAPVANSRAHRSTARTSSRSRDAAAPCRVVSVHRPADDVGDAGEAERAVEERRDRHFVGRVQHDRQALGPARAPGYASARHGNRVVSGRLELERPARARSSDGSGRVPPVRIRERVLNRQPHVGDAELRDDRAVDELHHRMHDRLRMDEHVDAVRGRRRTASAPR